MHNVETDNKQPQVLLDDDFEKLFEEYTRGDTVKEGEVVKGTVIHVGKEFVTVDIGFKSEGQIPVGEFTHHTGDVLVKQGDKIDVYVESTENETGLVELSKEKADKLKVWDQISDVVEQDGIVEGTITSRVKGGLTVDIGVKAFLPGSQVDLRPIRNLEKFIGQTHKFKIIKFNKKRGNIVLSRRALLEKQRELLKSQTLENLREGAVISGIIKNITEYGCFVDLGGIDGLLHITDMSWGRINHPSEMFEIGDEVKVKILKYDQDNERVSLGLKQISQDPWENVAERYAINQRVNGKVVSLTDYGAFVELEQGVEGLIHISEMSWTRRVKHPSKVVALGDIVDAVILDIEPENKRISLGMKQIEANPWELLVQKYPVGSIVRGKIRNITNFGIFVGIEEGIDGLIHVSDISWSNKVKHPGDLYKKGDEVEAQVLHIDIDKERFSLGIKQLQEDPWEKFVMRNPIGSVVAGRVTKVMDFGAIVEIAEDVEGLVHISELSDQKIDNISEFVREGDTLKAKVINLDPEERKIGLSVRQLSDETEAYQEFLKSQGSSSTQLGDLLRDRLGDLELSDKK
ncbi:MAG: 30S ribosomal protein S1 [Myxococcales bacterium]|nr:30S ribosomal protein S1 [Myxococcales bacterium]